MLRINQFAKGLGVSNFKVLEALENHLAIRGKSYSSNLTSEQEMQLRNLFKEQPLIRTLKEGDGFVGFLFAQEVAFKVGTEGMEFLEARLADASGDLMGFLGDIRAIDGDVGLIRSGTFLKVKGILVRSEGQLQFKLDKLRFATDSEVQTSLLRIGVQLRHTFEEEKQSFSPQRPAAIPKIVKTYPVQVADPSCSAPEFEKNPESMSSYADPGVILFP